LASIGGSSWQRLRYVAIPQIAAEFLSIFFYRLEINTRGAAISASSAPAASRHAHLFIQLLRLGEGGA
jgi:hypothetical protein